MWVAWVSLGTMSDPIVKHNEATSRFEIELEGQVVGFALYTDDPDSGVRELHATEVDPNHQGQGLAGRLIGEALQSTRAAGLKVDPVCPYVAAYVKRHPEYQDLLTEG